jgi:hypothetical protein
VGYDDRVQRCDLHVIASAAKQSILSLCRDMDCFAALAMTGMARIAPETPVCVGYDDPLATRKILQTGGANRVLPMSLTPM